MILWKCDGCGKTIETKYERHHSSSNEWYVRIPDIPENWWRGEVMFREDPDLRTLAATECFAIVCCGACADAATKKFEDKKRSVYWIGPRKVKFA